ncbi:MAG: low specificity L-threonine aldolase [Bacteroidales bacterium]|nr:low specificity L-threonine aldolase [Bacteroidales bacterium]
MSNRGFASDNASGVHPEILKAIENVNTGHVVAYGDDDYTEKAKAAFKQLFGKNSETFFVLTGTAANVLSINQLTNSYHSVIVAETAHQQVHECGAPERFAGCKYLSVPTPDGKLTRELILPHLVEIGDIHHSQPKIVSITQPTEVGTLYSVSEIKSLADFVHDKNMFLHLDGARIANAAVALDKSFKEITFDAGVDVISFGGTKNGMLLGEAVVFADGNVAGDFEYYRKQAMQLASKMRFISVQFLAYFENDLWQKNARHANRMAQLLYEKVKDVPEVEIIYPVQTNGVFARIPKEIIPKLQSEIFFYVFDEQESIVRWMCSFDTTEEDIENFVALLKKEIEKAIV